MYQSKHTISTIWMQSCNEPLSINRLHPELPPYISPFHAQERLVLILDIAFKMHYDAKINN